MVLRLGEGHGQAFFELVECQRERLRAAFLLTVESITSPQSGELAARRKLTEWYLEQSYSFGVWTLVHPRQIGYLSFKHIDWSVPKADMGYYIHAAMEGQGLMSEALQRALHWGFEELRLARVYLRIAPENIASQRLAERCGFVRGGVPHDMIYFGLTAGNTER